MIYDSGSVSGASSILELSRVHTGSENDVHEMCFFWPSAFRLIRIPGGE